MGEPSMQQHLVHIWEKLKHENDLINHRMSWLWTLQGLLFAAFGLLSKEICNSGKLPIVTICAVGMATCISVGYSALQAQQVLDLLHPISKKLTADIESKLSLEETPSLEPGTLGFLAPWCFLPWVFACAWVTLTWWVFHH